MNNGTKPTCNGIIYVLCNYDMELIPQKGALPSTFRQQITSKPVNYPAKVKNID